MPNYCFCANDLKSPRGKRSSLPSHRILASQSPARHQIWGYPDTNLLAHARHTEQQSARVCVATAQHQRALLLSVLPTVSTTGLLEARSGSGKTEYDDASGTSLNTAGLFCTRKTSQSRRWHFSTCGGHSVVVALLQGSGWTARHTSITACRWQEAVRHPSRIFNGLLPKLTTPSATTRQPNSSRSVARWWPLSVGKPPVAEWIGHRLAEVDAWP